MPKKLLAELRLFAETTSVRGIPRLMKAKTRVTFVVWLVAVLTCAALLVWQLSVVLTRYFQYPVSTLTVQAPGWQKPTFPDITICNLDPSVYDTTRNDSDANDILASLNESFSYTTNESPLTDNVLYYDAFQLNTYTVHISAAWNPWFYKCFTLRPMNSERENIRGINAKLYVDQVNDGPNGDSHTYIAAGTSGLHVLVHAPGSAPDMSYGMNISPGTRTIVEVTQSVRTRLGPPYSNCTDKPYLPWDNTSDAYTQPYCVNTCIQQKVVDQCGCASNMVPQYTIAQLRMVNFTICESISTSINYSCVNTILFSSNTSAACSAACVLQCSELQYVSASSVVPWPSAALLTTYSNSCLADPRFLHLFNVSENASQEEIDTAMTTSAATDFFKSRFLMLDVQFGSQSFVELKDVAAFSADAMGAQIGGVLSLWLGVTVMVAFEAIEFFYIYLTNCRKEEPTLQARSVSVAPAVDNPPRSALRRSHHGLRRSSN